MISKRLIVDYATSLISKDPDAGGSISSAFHGNLEGLPYSISRYFFLVIVIAEYLSFNKSSFQGDDIVRRLMRR